MSMKKILSIFAAILMVVAVNAKVWTVGPNHNEESDRADCNLYVTLDRLAQAGDTILMADGTYDEPYSAAIKNNVVIMAEEGASPLIQAKGYFELKANAEVFGLKFQFVGDAGNGYGFYIRENTPKYLKLEGCEFFDYPKYCVTGSSSSSHCDSVLVNNCYFHNCANGPFYFPASSLADNVNLCDRLEITNSTFANIDVVGWVSVIDLRNNNSSTAATSKLVVDHCTFYNCQGDYDRMIQSYKSPDAHITNCIMMNPVVEGKTEIYATYLYGGEIHHNLNYQTKRQYGSGVTVTDSICRDPLFVNAAEGNFTLGEGSPAIGAASDGSNLGDPRWVPAAEEMLTLYLKLSSDWAGWPAKYAIYYFDEGSNGWSNFMTLAEGEDDIYVGSIPAAYADDQIIFVRLDGAATEVNWANKWSQTVNLTIPEGKDFFTVISGGTGSECNGTWSKYGEVLPEAKFYIAGSMTGWAPNVVSYEDSYTLHLAAGAHKFKVVNLASEWKGFSDLTEAGRAAELYLDPDGNVCFVLAEEGDVVVTFTNELYKVEGAFVPALVQLIGINGWQVAEGHAIDLTPAEDHLTTSATVELADLYYEFKVIVADDWVGKAHGEAEGKYTIKNDWTWVDALSYEGDNIVLSMGDGDIVPGAYTFTWTYTTGKLEVTFPTATGITNTEVSEKVVKMIENGQLIIIKNGVRYNAQGAVVK